MEKVIEKQWVTKAGHSAEVVIIKYHMRELHPPPPDLQFIKGGHRCGYVTVLPTSNLYGKDYDSVSVDVHGGLTYGDQGKFGFDCAHMDDSLENCTLEYCVEECEKLSAQFAELEKQK